MKKLEILAAECTQDLLSIGIQPGIVNKWIINTRAKCRWGMCKSVAPGLFNISIAYCLLQDDINDQAAKDTILHELLHTVKGCNGHKGKWKELAAKVNKQLTQYTIKRTTSYNEKGIERTPVMRINKYAVRCLKCGKEYQREKKSKVIQHPEKYRCRICGSKLERVL